MVKILHNYMYLRSYQKLLAKCMYIRACVHMYTMNCATNVTLWNFPKLGKKLCQS